MWEAGEVECQVCSSASWLEVWMLPRWHRQERGLMELHFRWCGLTKSPISQLPRLYEGTSILATSPRLFIKGPLAPAALFLPLEANCMHSTSPGILAAEAPTSYQL